MKKFIVVCLALLCVPNITGYASEPTQKNNSKSQTTIADKKQRNLHSVLKIGFGTGMLVTIGAIVYKCLPGGKAQSNPAPQPEALADYVVPDEQIRGLQARQEMWLNEDFVLQSIHRMNHHSRVQWYGDCQYYNWVSQDMRSMLNPLYLCAFESPKNISTVFVDYYSVEEILGNLKQHLGASYSNIVGKYYPNTHFNNGKDGLYNQILADESWRSEPYKRGYLECYELYRDLNRQYESLRNNHTNIRGFLITENRSFGKNEKARYYIKTVTTQEAQRQNPQAEPLFLE